MGFNIELICRQFETRGAFVDAQAFGSGHINDTYLVTHDDNGICVLTVLQRINHEIFKNPPSVMENIIRVTNHIRKKLQAEGADNIPRRVLTVLQTHNGNAYHRDPDGNYWRQYLFIENGKTYNTPQSPELVYRAARAFGRFLKMLEDLAGPPLNESIPDFHNGPERLRTFQEALIADLYNRAKNAKPEIDFVLQHAAILDVLPRLIVKRLVPIRVTHNDTKINNIIFDVNTGESLCIIDLDTVMPGSILYDFGDMVRTATCPAPEDEKNLSKVTIQTDLFEALVRGFLEETAGFITATERQHLLFGGKAITFEQTVRFLTDHLLGDVYYRTSYTEHNLDRCRTQLKLVQSIMQQEETLSAMVERS